MDTMLYQENDLASTIYKFSEDNITWYSAEDLSTPLISHRWTLSEIEEVSDNFLDDDGSFMMWSRLGNREHYKIYKRPKKHPQEQAIIEKLCTNEWFVYKEKNGSDTTLIENDDIEEFFKFLEDEGIIIKNPIDQKKRKLS